MFSPARYGPYIIIFFVGLCVYLFFGEGWFFTAQNRHDGTDAVLSSGPIPVSAPLGCSVSPNIALRIMALGDSITHGRSATDETGYRRFLYDRLAADCASRAVRYIGSQQSGLVEAPGAHAVDESEGYGGFDIPHILDTSRTNFPATLARRPNVVLLHVGTNDLSPLRLASEDPPSAAPRNLETLIDRVLELAPNVTLLVAQIISSPNPGWREDIPLYNAAIPAIVDRKIAAGYKLVLVDMTPVGIECVLNIDGSGVDCPDLWRDGLHPRDEGFRKMADIWFEGLRKATHLGLITA